MDKAELIEEIRALLREPQEHLVSQPWTYIETEFYPQIRSAMRHLTAKGVATANIGAMATDGSLTSEPSARCGVLIALAVANRLLTGDLMRKLRDGEMGVIFRAGSDFIDTKQAAKGFETAASNYQQDFDTLLAIELANADGGDKFFGPPEPQMA